MRIAILDDEPVQLDLLGQVVGKLGHECSLFETGRALRGALQRETFDLLILDWQLPDISGPDIARWARTHLQDRVPILFVTSRQDDRDIATALAIGADDFMVKPIMADELSARVSALLRRTNSTEADEYSWGRYRFVPASQCLTLDGRPVTLTPKEFELALFLFKYQGRILTRQDILDAVWSHGGRSGTAPNSRSLDTHISTLRRALELRPEMGYRLRSIYGQGYRLEALH
jgi:DNA-binding response OmpR family regulator